MADRSLVERLRVLAAQSGVVKITTACSLLGGYGEVDDLRERWSCVVQRGANVHAVSRGATEEEALARALEQLGVVAA